MTRRRLGLGLCAIGGVVTAVVLAQPVLDYRWSREPAAQDSTNIPTVPVDVMLDPAGRPYDLALPRRATIERRRLATLVAPSRRVVTLGGEEVPYVKSGDHESLTLAARPRDAYPIDAIWVKHPELGYDEIVGVVITERESPIVTLARAPIRRVRDGCRTRRDHDRRVDRTAEGVPQRALPVV